MPMGPTRELAGQGVAESQSDRLTLCLVHAWSNSVLRSTDESGVESVRNLF